VHTQHGKTLMGKPKTVNWNWQESLGIQYINSFFYCFISIVWVIEYCDKDNITI